MLRHFQEEGWYYLVEPLLEYLWKIKVLVFFIVVLSSFPVQPVEEYSDFTWRISLKSVSLQLTVALQEDRSY